MSRRLNPEALPFYSSCRQPQPQQEPLLFQQPTNQAILTGFVANPSYPFRHAPFEFFSYHHHQLVKQETLFHLHLTHGPSYPERHPKMGSIPKSITPPKRRNKKFFMGGRYGRNRDQKNRNIANEKKQADNNSGGCSSAPRPDNNIIPFPPTMQELERSQTTTVMIKNIPNQYKLKDLLLILDDHCLQLNKTSDPADWSKFDFVYLPMDYRKHAFKGRISNLGYAFVNFTTCKAAFKFYQRFNGLVWSVTENKIKTCEITTAQFQGKDRLMRKFEEKVFRCNSRDFLPVVFSEARDGFNRQIEGTPVGNHVRGLPGKTIGS